MKNIDLVVLVIIAMIVVVSLAVIITKKGL